MKSMTYGTLPTREEFDAAFERECPKGTYDVQLGTTDSAACDDFYFGDGTWPCDQLWGFIVRVVVYSLMGLDDVSPTMDVVSSVLHTLGFEWV